ncbi:MmcQ/YjbR family DNA-binding protein [Pedococcus cremeus]|nr:MmcQ/YjbR family DNA-binding protein [Pedococcus cremeus]
MTRGRMNEARARLADLDAVAMRLPGVERSTSPDGRHSYEVAGKAFVLSRSPRKDAVDPETGERMEDVLVFWVADLGDKDALVQGDGPFFTTPHWNGYKGVLLRERDLGQVSRRELEEVVTDAWLARAPKRLAQEFLAGPGEPT